jgi:putative ABC transport system permease protein
VIGLLSVQGARSTATGIGAGALAALWLTPLAAGLLYDVSPTDPATFIAAAIGLFGAALLGTIVPACRAAKVDPLTAIRAD